MVEFGLVPEMEDGVPLFHSAHAASVHTGQRAFPVHPCHLLDASGRGPQSIAQRRWTRRSRRTPEIDL